MINCQRSAEITNAAMSDVNAITRYFYAVSLRIYVCLSCTIPITYLLYLTRDNVSSVKSSLWEITYLMKNKNVLHWLTMIR